MATEKRLIDANDAEKFAREHILDAKERFCILDFLRDCSTVDAVEVVHGYTIPAEEPKTVYLDRKCGICDQLMLSTDVFCPMCGARMDGVSDG